MLFEQIIQNYTKYIKSDYDKKLHAGELLAESARLLLKIEKKELSNDLALQRNYLMQKIAEDLLRQAKNMGYTKQYDCVPALKEYTYLAYDLAYDYCDNKPSRYLLPFLVQVIYYEKQSQNSDRLNELEKIYKKSLAIFKEHSKKIMDPNNTIYKSHI